MRLSRALAVAAALFTAAPALAAPVEGITWLSICTEHGAALLPVPSDEAPVPEAKKACHAACTCPRKAALKRRRASH